MKKQNLSLNFYLWKLKRKGEENVETLEINFIHTSMSLTNTGLTFAFNTFSRSYFQLHIGDHVFTSVCQQGSEVQSDTKILCEASTFFSGERNNQIKKL